MAYDALSDEQLASDIAARTNELENAVQGIMRRVAEMKRRLATSIAVPPPSPPPPPPPPSPPSAPGVTITERPIPIGGMGYTTGEDLAQDGSYMIAWCDGGGLFRRDWSGSAWSAQWEPLIDRERFPDAAFRTVRVDTVNVTTGQPETRAMGACGGAWGAAISPADPNRIYASVSFTMWRSDDRGRSWVATGLQRRHMHANAQGAGSFVRLSQNKVVADPVGRDVAYCAVQYDYVYRTTDADQFLPITSVPKPTMLDDNAYCVIAIDPTSPVANGRKSRIVIWSAGNGVYLIDEVAGATTQILATTDRMFNMRFDPAGKLWLMNRTLTSQNVRTWTAAGGWSGPIGVVNQQIKDVAFDPARPGYIYASAYFMSKNGGESWIGPWAGSEVATIAVDSPLFAAAAAVRGGSLAGWLVHPQSDTIHAGTGLGPVRIPLPEWAAMTGHFNTRLKVYESVAGIENLPAQRARILPDRTRLLLSQDNAVIAVPPGGSWPKKAWKLIANVIPGTSIDYAPQDYNWLACVLANGAACATSTDKGETWTPWPTIPAGAGLGGDIVVTAPGKMVISLAGDQWPQWTDDGGNTWADCTFSGYAKPAAKPYGWVYGNYTDHRCRVFSQDKNDPTRVFLYNCVINDPSRSGVWESRDGGKTFVHIFSGTIENQLFTWHNDLQFAGGYLWFHTRAVSQWDNYVPAMRLWRGKINPDRTVTWTAMPGLSTVQWSSFGAPAKGQAGKTLYICALGEVDRRQHIWRCRNPFEADPAACLWEKLTPDPAMADTVFWLEADPVAFGSLVLGFGGKGWVEVELKA